MIFRLTPRLVPLALSAALAMSVAPSGAGAQGAADPNEEYRSLVAPIAGKPLSDLAPEMILELAAALDALSREYPDSNLALQIILGETVEGVDIAELKRRAAEITTAMQAPVAPASAAPEATAADATPPAVETPEAASAPPEDAAATLPMDTGTADTSADGGPAESPTAAVPDPATAEPAGATDAAAEQPPVADAAPLPGPGPEPAPVVFANLPAAVTACLSVGLLPPVELQMQIAVDGEGQIVGVPQILNPDQTARGLREAYLTALLALDGCIPLRAEGGAGVVVARIATDGLVVASLQSEQDNASAVAAAGPEEAPTPPAALLPTNAETEADLNLSKKDIREVQARLQIMGFDPNGIDGALGRGARAAISAWQAQEDLPKTGYLGRAQLLILKLQSDDAYSEWLKVEANSKLIESGPARSGGTGRYIDSRGCLREANGKAVPNFKAGCR